MKTSETREIRRSQIRLNPANPKRHTNEKIKQQVRNFRKTGYLGGIVWNELSGNLIDGHRRILAMDLYYKYDGTEATDYTVKVEVVALDDRQEKEQMTYMAVANTRADFDLIAEYSGDIDLTDVGLTESEIGEIRALADIGGEDVEEIEDLFGDQKREEEKPKKTKEEKTSHVKDIKAQVKAQAEERAKKEEAYITLSFSSYENYLFFCECIGAKEGDKFAKGEDVLGLLDN